MISPSKRLIISAFSIARPYRRPLAAILFLHLIATPVSLLKPFALKILIDSGFGKHALPEFIRILFPENFNFSFSTIAVLSAGLFILTSLIENLYSVAVWVLSISTGEKMVLSFRTILFNHIQRLSLKHHDQKGASDSLYRIQYDTMAIRTLFIGNLSPIIAALATLVGMIIVMLMINWHFALIALSLIPVLFILTRISVTRLQKKWRKVKEDESFAMSIIHEVLNAMRVIKAFGREEGEAERFRSSADEAVKGQIKVGWLAASYSFMVEMLFASGTAFFIYTGAMYVNSGKMTLGELTLVLAYLAQIYIPLVKIVRNINDIQSSMTSIERVFNLLDQEKEVKESANPLPLSQSRGHIAFQEVSFSYQSEKQVLENISFEIKPGDRVGIMGSTGAGKTSLISLLLRFYDCNSGKIMLDGNDIRNYRLSDYRKQFAIVLQDPLLFSTSIAENISVGLPGAAMEEIIGAAKLANAHHFIMNSVNGYDTLVGERGMQLSGGERQRISLARAFIKNAPILILDEPTSAIDLKTETQIIEAMERLMRGRTTFLISHRLDALRSSNIILHLEQGKIIDILHEAAIDVLELKKKAYLFDNDPF
ncbi:MAG: transporter ATP-binding protein [Mucilaginibacter sp.]|nr:transporter ATP-binding protein [Mucilaginibacter sp.]